MLRRLLLLLHLLHLLLLFVCPPSRSFVAAAAHLAIRSAWLRSAQITSAG